MGASRACVCYPTLAWWLGQPWSRGLQGWRKSRYLEHFWRCNNHLWAQVRVVLPRRCFDWGLCQGLYKWPHQSKHAPNSRIWGSSADSHRLWYNKWRWNSRLQGDWNFLQLNLLVSWPNLLDPGTQQQRSNCFLCQILMMFILPSPGSDHPQVPCSLVGLVCSILWVW